MIKREQKGFTLTEFVIAMAITAITGLAVAGVSMALSRAYAHSENFYQYLQCSRAGIRHTQEVFSEAKLITAADGDTTVLWHKDINDDAQINLSEIKLIDHDSENNEVAEYSIVFPDDMSPATRAALDENRDLSWAMDIPDVRNELLGHNYCQKKLLATDVTSFSVSCQTSPPRTRLVQMTFDVGRPEHSIKLRSAAMLRADRTAYVGISDGEYVLETSPTE